MPLANSPAAIAGDVVSTLQIKFKGKLLIVPAGIAGITGIAGMTAIGGIPGIAGIADIGLPGLRFAGIAGIAENTGIAGI